MKTFSATKQKTKCVCLCFRYKKLFEMMKTFSATKQWEKKIATKSTLKKDIVRNHMYSGHCVVQIDFCKVLIFDGSEGWFGFCSVKKWTLRSANCKK